MPDNRAAQWDFPKEVWQRIIYWVPRMNNQPHWHAWTELRGTSRAFKSTIDDYYFEHYVKRTKFNIRCGELLNIYAEIIFSFSHFDDEEKRIVVFTENESADLTEQDHSLRYRWLSLNANRQAGDPGFNANTIVTVRHELTDMLPIDLKIDYSPGKATYKFDWRTYYSTYFDEERAKAAIYESKIPEFEAEKARISAQVRAGTMSMQDVLEQTLKIVGQYAGEGAEGLFVPVRRKRRLRIGFKVPQRKQWLEEGDEKRHKFFAEFDEDIVLAHIKKMRQPLALAEFSDSEDGEEDGEEDEEEDDDETDVEDGDDEDEWEDEDGEEEDEKDDEHD